MIEEYSFNMVFSLFKTIRYKRRIDTTVFCCRKTPKYKTPAPVKKSRISPQQNMYEKKRLSFDCCADHDNTQMGQFFGISPCEVENIEERLEECLLQLEKVRETFSLCSY